LFSEYQASTILPPLYGAACKVTGQRHWLPLCDSIYNVPLLFFPFFWSCGVGLYLIVENTPWRLEKISKATCVETANFLAAALMAPCCGTITPSALRLLTRMANTINLMTSFDISDLIGLSTATSTMFVAWESQSHSWYQRPKKSLRYYMNI
jgi:hypothetical protein